MVLSIVTLNYKKPDLTLACVASLQKQFEKAFNSGEVELIIVDNASGDDSVERFHTAIKKEGYKHTRVIANKENAGFGKGCNTGAKEAQGSVILFLNNDTLVKDDGIMKMAEYMKGHPEAAILGGQLQNSDGTLQFSTAHFYTPFHALLLLLGLQKFGLNQPTTITQVDWVKGGLLMIQKNIFEKLGGFDDKIFMYIEDMELCYRAQKAGYKTFFYPEVSVLHKEHGSASRTFAIVNIYKNLLYFYSKHRSTNEYLFIKTIMQTKAIILIAFGKVLGNNYLTKTYEEALKVL